MINADTYPSACNFNPVDFDPFAGPEILLLAPATEPQIEIWLSCIFGGDEASCAYNESYSMLLKGDTDVDALRKAVESLMKRHEALRSVFSPDGSKMVIYDYLQPGIDFEDISAKSSAQREQAITAYHDADMCTPFNLVDGPLMRVKIFKLTDDVHQVTLTLHHIVCDGWSFGVIMQELGKYYTACVTGAAPDLLAAPRYSEYAVEQIAFQETAEYKDIEKYWLKGFEGSIPLAALPVDKARPQRRTYHSGHYKHTLNSRLSADIKKLAAGAGCSLVTTLLAAFEVWLQNLTGQPQIVTGLPAAGQTATGQLGLVGHCVNLLPLKSTADAAGTFLQYLKKRRLELLDAYDNQLITYGTLLKKLNVPRNSSRLPLVSVVFNSDMGMDDGISFYNLSHQLSTPPRKFENFELFVNVNNLGSGLHLDWSYNSGLFVEESIIAMMNGFENLLTRVTAEPNLLVGDLACKAAAKPDKATVNLNNKASVQAPGTPLLRKLISLVLK